MSPIADAIPEFRRFFKTFTSSGLAIQLESSQQHPFFPAARTADEQQLVGRYVRGDIVETSSRKPVGRISRDLCLDGDRLVVVQHVLRLAPTARRSGFGGALQQAAEEMYRHIGVNEVRAEAQGDGSLFLARRGFDLDVDEYRRSRNRASLSDAQIVTQALYLALKLNGTDLVEDPILETREYREGPPRVLEEVARLSTEGSDLVAQFRERQPRGLDEPSQHPQRFASIRDVLEFGRGSVVPGLPNGLSLGEAVLRSTMWHAKKTLAGC